MTPSTPCITRCICVKSLSQNRRGSSNSLNLPGHRCASSTTCAAILAKALLTLQHRSNDTSSARVIKLRTHANLLGGFILKVILLGHQFQWHLRLLLTSMKEFSVCLTRSTFSTKVLKFRGINGVETTIKVQVSACKPRILRENSSNCCFKPYSHELFNYQIDKRSRILWIFYSARALTY